MDNDKQSLNNAENPSATDATQQPIFTPNPAPQPSAPAQNQQVITGSVVEPASARLSHQYYSNHPTKTSASGTGDIVVSNAYKVKTKIPIFIGIIVTLIVLIIVIIIVAVSSTKKTSPIAKAENEFYEFANYTLYGQKQNNKLSGEYNSNSSYELDKQFYNKNIEFLNEAVSLLKGTIDEYTRVGGPEVLSTKLQDIYDDLEFLITFLNIEEPDEEKVLSTFLQSGYDATLAYLVRFYESFWEMGSTEAQYYATQRYEQYAAMAEMLQFYSEHGCIRNNVVNMNCPLVDDVERASELADIMNSNERISVNVIPNLLKAVESSCWQVSYYFQNISNLGNEDYEKE